MKLKLPRINQSKIQYALKYLLIILLTALIFVLLLIAMPLTEKFTNLVSYDLITKEDSYWAQEYVLELDTEGIEDKETSINKVRSIIEERLNKFGLEKVTTKYKVNEENKDTIEIDVQTTKSQTDVEELLRYPFQLTVVTRKEEVDFENSEDPYAIYMGENYNQTDFNRDSFRNIFITKLLNSSNEYSYFALFKAWPWNTKWNTFLNDHKGETIGVLIDGFVTPVTISTSDPMLFAVPLSVTEKSDANLVSMLYNSGSMPIPYTFGEQKDIDIEYIEADYVKITEGILIAVILIYGYLIFIDKTPRNTLILSGLSTLVAISIWISYLKISEIPIDIFILAIEVIAMIAIIRMTTENKESNIIINVLIALVCAISVILGSGYIKEFASDMLILLIIGNISQLISTYYLSNLKIILMK